MRRNWQEPLKNLAKTLSRQEQYQEILSGIDYRIIKENDISDTIEFTSKQILQLSGAKGISFVIGKSEILFGENSDDYHFEDIEIKKNEKDLSIYVDKFIVKFEIDKTDPYDLNLGYIENDLIEMIGNIGVQINIAINQSVSTNVHNLYKDIINDFSKSGDSNKVYETICKKITNVFPQIERITDKNVEDVHIQLLYSFKDKDHLLIIGSTESSDIGGKIHYSDNSISGTLISLASKDSIDGNYRCEYFKGNRYVYFIGDPSIEGSNYKKTISEVTKSELAVPLYLNDMTPIGVINLETKASKYFSESQARSLIYLGDSIAELVHNVVQLSQRRKDTVSGMMHTIKEYVRTTLREFDHQVSQPLQRINSLSNKLEKGVNFNNEVLLNKLSNIHLSMINAKKMLSSSLNAFSQSSKTINLKNIIDEVKLLLAEPIKSDNVNFSVDINSDVKIVKLDNLFTQYLYDLLRNSFDSIALKRIDIIKSDTEVSYSPKIKITANLIDEFGLDDGAYSDINNKRCLISIWDNGLGFPSEKITYLGGKGFSYGKKHGSGTGLYSFKNYLAFHNSRIVKYDSNLNEFFSISFIVDIID